MAVSGFPGALPPAMPLPKIPIPPFIPGGQRPIPGFPGTTGGISPAAPGDISGPGTPLPTFPGDVTGSTPAVPGSSTPSNPLNFPSLVACQVCTQPGAYLLPRLTDCVICFFERLLGNLLLLILFLLGLYLLFRPEANRAIKAAGKALAV